MLNNNLHTVCVCSAGGSFVTNMLTRQRDLERMDVPSYKSKSKQVAYSA